MVVTQLPARGSRRAAIHRPSHSCRAGRRSLRRHGARRDWSPKPVPAKIGRPAAVQIEINSLADFNFLAGTVPLVQTLGCVAGVAPFHAPLSRLETPRGALNR